jgi:hypothetical protein
MFSMVTTRNLTICEYDTLKPGNDLNTRVPVVRARLIYP